MDDQDTAARAAYAEDVRRRPLHHDGTARAAWDGLSDFARETWRRNPTPRNWTAWEPNGLPRGVTLSDFTGFCLSPVRETEGDGVSVCRPQEAGFWSVYGYRAEAREWQIVHDADARDMGEALARIAETTFQRIEYRDPDRAYPDATLRALSELIAQRLNEDRAAADHPLAVVRAGIVAALKSREA